MKYLILMAFLFIGCEDRQIINRDAAIESYLQRRTNFIEACKTLADACRLSTTYYINDNDEFTCKIPDPSDKSLEIWGTHSEWELRRVINLCLNTLKAASNETNKDFDCKKKAKKK